MDNIDKNKRKPKEFTKMKKVKKTLAMLMALVMFVSTAKLSVYATESSNLYDAVSNETSGVNWDGTTTESVYETENCRITFSLTGYWFGGYNANIKIENTSESVIENWYLNFASDNVISNIWNAQIYNYDNGKYIVQNAGWNQDVAVGESVEFGFSGNESFLGFPEEYELISSSALVSEEDYKIDYHVDSDWGSGFCGSISIANNANTVLEDWILEFDFDREITGIWNGVIESHEGNHYVIRNAGYNSNINANQSVSIGFNGCEGTVEDEPSGFALYSYSMSMAENSTEIDLNVDSDNDGIPDYNEDKLGTDKNNPDTDSDGINDYEERNFGYSPINKDTNQNEVLDGEEDLDHDGIINSDEEKIGTDLADIDTDDDELKDKEELDIYGTAPTNSDTDADGLLDGVEIKYGMDPLVSDTNNDGIMDSEENVTHIFSAKETVDDYDENVYPTMKLSGNIIMLL